MCGRFCIAASPGEIEEEFGVTVPVEFRPRYNVAPGQLILTVTGSSAYITEWGFHTGGTKRIINARIEMIHKNPRFKEYFITHRCLVPASGYYEWKLEGRSKIPYYFSSPYDPLFALAGLYRSDSTGFQVVIITTGAMPPYAEIHDRMPVALSLSDMRKYLAGGDIPPTIVLQGHEVSSRVNQVAIDDPGLILPAEKATEQKKLEF
jgi:putative SOS response-associated peptidase YedK